MKALKKEWVVIVLALVVGLLSVAPHVLARHALGNTYQGYPFIYLDDEDLYMGNIQEVIDGNYAVSSPALFEYKNSYPTQLPVGSYLYALPTLLLHIPLTYTIIASKFLFPAILFLLIYIVSLNLLGSTPRTKITAYTIGLLSTLGLSVIDPSTLKSILSNSGIYLELWTRPVNPIFGALMLFGLLATLLSIHNSTKSNRDTWIEVLIAGVLLGGSIAYFFSWFLAVSITGLLWLYFLVGENPKEILLRYVLLISVMLQSTYWYHTLFSVRGTAGHAFALHNGALFTHIPLLNKVVLLTLGVYAFLSLMAFYRHKRAVIREKWWIFCTILLLACGIAFTEQIITGFTIWPYHFTQYTIPLCFLVILVAFHHLIAPFIPRLSSFSMILICVCTLAIGVDASRTYVHMLPDFAERQTYMPLFNRLSSLPAPCVVLVDEPEDKISRLITAFTHCDVYATSYVFFGVPEDRIFHNYLVHLRLSGVTPTTLPDYLKTHTAEINANFFTDYPHALSPTATDETTNAIAQITSAYPNFYAEDFLTEIKKYRVDYIVSASSTLTTLSGSEGWKKEQFDEEFLFTVVH